VVGVCPWRTSTMVVGRDAVAVVLFAMVLLLGAQRPTYWRSAKMVGWSPLPLLLRSNMP
jgi:hypothetical protein